MNPDEGQPGAIANVLARHEAELLSGWVREQLAAGTRRADLISEGELREQSARFLHLLREAVASGNLADVEGPAWARVREMLAAVSRSRSLRGFSPSETATFVFSFKQPLFERLRREVRDPEILMGEVWAASRLLDSLGLYTVEVHQRSREEVILRQQQDVLELSTPVVQLWEGVLALPLIGTLDSGRTSVVMESLLQAIVDTGSEIAILDITGVPTVDTLTAQHLLKTVTAARLMGADCILSGIRPNIAQTIVQLGIDLTGVTTKSTLKDALATALRRLGRGGEPGGRPPGSP